MNFNSQDIAEFIIEQLVSNNMIKIPKHVQSGEVRDFIDNTLAEEYEKIQQTSFMVDGWNNLCRVFELPKEFSPDYCFGGGVSTAFLMIDWFQPVPLSGTPAISKKAWIEKGLKIEVKAVTLEELKASLEPFIKEKKYYNPERKYIIIFDFGATLLI